MPLWTDAYLADTTHLTTIEHGAYLLLLMTMWRAGGSLPNDDRQLARYARLSSTQWARVKPTLMAFFHIEDDEITQGRLTDELAFVRQQRQSQSDKARAKWRKYNNAHQADGAIIEGRQTAGHAPVRREGESPSNTARAKSRKYNDSQHPAADAAALPPHPHPYTSPNGLAGEAPADEPDGLLVFREGVSLFVDTGESEQQARRALGKLRKAAGNDDARLLAAIREARRQKVVDLYPWLVKALEASDGGSGTSTLGKAFDRLQSKIDSSGF